MGWGKKNKFNATKVTYENFSFASKGEAGLYMHLKAMEQNNEISEIRAQETIYLTDARIIYKPDFSFIKNDRKEYAEFKGFETPEWRIKRRLWISYGPSTLYIYKGYGKSLKLYETIVMP